MDWKQYENEVASEFARIYSKATIQKNLRRPGRKSQTPRQIDVLVTETGPGFISEIFVDAKQYKDKVDIKDVESFIGMLDDVGSDHGILVSNKGFTSGAVARVIQERNVDLDILNFDELAQFQSYCAIPYHGKNGAIITPPLGWVIDAAQRGVAPACLFPRGLTYEEAVLSDTWMYVSFWDLNDPVNTLEGLVEQQNERLRNGRKKVDIVVRYPSLRSDYRVVIRVADVDENPCLELTGYILFKDFILFSVIFCKREMLRVNQTKLEWFLQRPLPLGIKYENKPGSIPDPNPK